MNVYKSLEECLHQMNNTLQCEGMTIYQHGVSVHETYLELLDILNHQKPNIYNIPPVLFTYYENNKSKLLTVDVMKEYHIMHDCGKPLCLEYDANNKRHFPNHAECSFLQYSELSNNTIIADLIRRDMCFHTIKGEELKKLWESENSTSLYLTAWAEIISNSNMFGGIDSVSFKIKKKHLIKSLRSIWKKKHISH